MYKHGVSATERPTSISPPSSGGTPGLPVVFGTAPIHLANERAEINKPILCFTYEEAVSQFGYSSDWKKYTLCEFMKSHFSLYKKAPVVFVNVLGMDEHKKQVQPVQKEAKNGIVQLEDDGILLETLTIKADSTELEKDTDYFASFNEKGKLVITLDDDSITEIEVSYTHLDPSSVDRFDIIGGIDSETGNVEGLENIDRVFPLYRMVPGLIVANGWSHDPMVASVMVAKASNINGLFKCEVLTDIPTDVVKKYTDVGEWKETNNYTNNRQISCWPKVKLGDEQYHLSTQLAGVICNTDYENEDIPYVSLSNKNLQINSAVLSDGTEISLGPNQAAFLNGQGIVTALNFIGGWRAWGNRTSAYPATTDPKDSFIPVRRMFDWIQNNIILTSWQWLDNPVKRRQVEMVVDSLNIWLNGLTARGFILGGRIEFHPDENPETDLMDGITRYHVYVTPPSPNRQMEFVVEYDPQYLGTLFG